MPLSLNKYTLDGLVWIASDIHLGPAIPRTCEVFYQWLQSSPADHIVLVGDIFNFWVGDDIPTTDLSAFHCSAKLYLMPGNRDFLIGPSIAQRLHATLWDESVVIQNGGQSFLITHGDQFCTHDHAYMRLRWWTQQAWLRALFLHLPQSWRLRIAQKIRQTSQNKGYRPQFHEIDYQAISPYLQAYPDVQGVIHGHTHQPQIEPFQYHDHTYTRWVLPDWEYDHQQMRGGYIQLENGQLTLFQEGASHWSALHHPHPSAHCPS